MPQPTAEIEKNSPRSTPATGVDRDDLVDALMMWSATSEGGRAKGSLGGRELSEKGGDEGPDRQLDRASGQCHIRTARLDLTDGTVALSPQHEGYGAQYETSPRAGSDRSWTRWRAAGVPSEISRKAAGMGLLGVRTPSRSAARAHSLAYAITVESCSASRGERRHNRQRPNEARLRTALQRGTNEQRSAPSPA